MVTIAKLGAPIAPFFMDKIVSRFKFGYGQRNFRKYSFGRFSKIDASFVDPSLERKMENAQIISSLVLSLRAKEKIKGASAPSENHDSCRE